MEQKFRTERIRQVKSQIIYLTTHKLAFVRCAVQFHYILLYMSRCIKMGLFQLFNIVWLVHCLKSQIAMMKLIGEYFGFDGVSFQIIVINS